MPTRTISPNHETASGSGATVESPPTNYQTDNPLTDLILVPTPLEMAKLRPLLDAKLAQSAFQVCGFGPITAAARTAGLISRYHAERVILIGLAGSFEPSKHPLGTACRFDEVACHGVGVGSGTTYQSAGDMGWQQFSGGDHAQPQISDTISLAAAYVAGIPNAGQLLTSCCAAANAQEASLRQQQFPSAVAEDMEGFAVAAACALASVPLQIVRGLSNEVGDRDHTNWQVDQALSAAAEMTLQLVSQTWMPSLS